MTLRRKQTDKGNARDASEQSEQPRLGIVNRLPESTRSLVKLNKRTRRFRRTAQS